MVERTVRSLVLAAAVVLVPTISPNPARACGNSIIPEDNYKVYELKHARRYLEQEKYAAAGFLIRKYINVATAQSSRDPTSAGLLRAMALAVARSKGRVSPSSLNPGDAKKNMDWAVDALRRINEHHKNEAWRQTDLAEVLAMVPQHKAEARALLESLAARDVVATAEGYAALARLRAEAGDSTGRDAALARCKLMTKKPALCGARQA